MNLRILFITANRIGDAVLTTGLLAHLVETYPDALVTVACGPVAADLFRAVPRLEKLIILRKKKNNGHWIALWKSCVGTRWELIVDLRNSLVTRFLFAGEKRYRLAHNTGRHKVVDHAEVLSLVSPPSPHIWTDAPAEQEAARHIMKGELVLALGPTANWPPKQWPMQRFVSLARQLIAKDGPMKGAKVALIGAPEEKDQMLPLYASLPHESIINLVGQDLLTVAACLAKARLFIGNDSGLTHIAAAMGAPTLALFGPGWEKIYGPWGAHTAVVRPPESSQELLDKLPYAGAFEPNLMESLTVEDALAAAKELLERTRHSG